MLRSILRSALWLASPPSHDDLRQAVVDGDVDTILAIVRRVPDLAHAKVLFDAPWTAMLFAALHDSIALYDACRDCDRLAHASAYPLRRIDGLPRFPLFSHPQVVAVPLNYLGIAKLASSQRVYAELWRTSSDDERLLCMPLAIALRDDAWLAELVERGARADAIEYASYHLAMLEPTPAQLALIIATGGLADPIVSTAPPGFEEGDHEHVPVSEAHRRKLGYWMSAFLWRATPRHSAQRGTGASNGV